MKLVKNIIFTILAFCITSNAFAQELSDKEIGLDVVKIVTRLKERGIDDSKIIEKEVATVREMYKKTYIELQKKEKEISNEIRRKAVKKVSQKKYCKQNYFRYSYFREISFRSNI